MNTPTTRTLASVVDELRRHVDIDVAPYGEPLPDMYELLADATDALGIATEYGLTVERVWPTGGVRVSGGDREIQYFDFDTLTEVLIHYTETHCPDPYHALDCGDDTFADGVTRSAYWNHRVICEILREQNCDGNVPVDADDADRIICRIDVISESEGTRLIWGDATRETLTRYILAAI
jgi:hypothetical protein